MLTTPIKAMQKSDSQLLSACRRGDDAAWEALVRRYQRLIYAIPRRAGLNDDSSADVFQEVFTTLINKLSEIEEPDRLQAWLVTTAKRKTWKAIAKAHDRRLVSFEIDEENEGDELANLPDGASLADEELLRLEEQHRVRTAVSALDERCAKLVRMLFYESEPPPYSQIAAALGTSEGSIGPTRARCLEKMLRLLKKN